MASRSKRLFTTSQVLEDLEASSGSEDLDGEDIDSSSDDDYFTKQGVLSDSESEGDISVGSLDSRPSHAGSACNVYNDSFDSMDDDLAQSSDRSSRDRSPSPSPPRGRPRGTEVK
jgi:serine-aspartate repeat-containing protein C/D/E